MSFNNYCSKCQKNCQKNGKFCESCGTLLTYNHNFSPGPTISEKGIKYGKTIGQTIVNGSVKIAESYRNSNQTQTPKYQTTSSNIPNIQQNNYSELITLFSTLESIGRFVITASKILVIIFIIICTIISMLKFANNPAQPTQSFIIFIFPIFPSIIICLPLYLTGLILTALPQIILLIKDCRDYLQKISCQLDKISKLEK